MVEKFNPASLIIVALPVPSVEREIEPSTARLTMLMIPSLASVVAIKLPTTVTVPLSAIPAAAPVVMVRLPPTEAEAISIAVVPLSMVTLAFAPVLLKVNAPVNALVKEASLRVMVSLVLLVVKDEVPPIVRFPLCVMDPSDSTTRLPLKVSA